MPTQRELRLRIEPVNGLPVNDYRIRDGRVEVRLLDASGRPFPDARSDWRLLDANDIQLHHNLGTVVSKWLDVRLFAEPFTLDKTA